MLLFKTYNEIAGSLVHVFRISVRAVMMVIVAQMMLHMEVCQKWLKEQPKKNVKTVAVMIIILDTVNFIE